MSSRRSRRSQGTQPKYATDDFDMETDLDSYNSSTNSKRSTRSKPDIETSNNNPSIADLDDAAEEEDVIDEVEEITRCICGDDDLVIPKNHQGDFDNVDPGFFIQCEICSVWQHGYCVGIKDEEDAPEKYWCEKCKPQNHTLFTDKYGTRRSKYDPLHPHNNHNGNNHQKKGTKRKNGRYSQKETDLNEDDTKSLPHVNNNENVGATDNDKNDENSEYIDNKDNDANHKRKHRKRSSIYNYEEMLKKALEESAKESGVTPEEINISSTESIEGRELRHQPSRKTRTRLHDLYNHNDDISHDDDPKNNDYSATITTNGDNNDNANDNTPNSTLVKPGKQTDKRKNRDMKRSKSRRNASATSGSNDEHEGDIEDKHLDIARVTKSSNLLNNFDSSNSPKRTTKKEKKDLKSNGANDDKPFRANIPSARINMNEMTRRIFSINDFVSNIQINLTNEEEFKNNLFKMNDSELTPEIVELKNKLIECYNDSVQYLDELTSLLNVWQDNYA